MKVKNHLSLTVLCIASVVVAHAQTNTFPSTGNVGIGTLSPANKLTVLTGSNATGIVHTDGTIKVGTYVGGSGGWLGTVSNHPLYFYTNNGASQITLLTNGRVGIGTATPAGKLDVVGEDAFIQLLRIGRGRVTGNLLDSTNTAVGRYSLQNNNPGYYPSISNHGINNTALGYRTLANNTEGFDNTAAGAWALHRSTTGEMNTAFGSQALYNNTTGSANAALGDRSLEANSTGGGNTAIGYLALGGNTNGNSNVVVGFESLDDCTTATCNVALGTNILSYRSNVLHTISIGYSAPVGADYQARIGSSYITSIGGYVNWTNISDGRVKRNIKENVPGIDFIKLLKPVTYNLQLDAIDKLNKVPAEKIAGEKDKSVLEGRAAKEKIIYSGFIAQDVEKAARSLGYDFSGVDAPKDGEQLYGLRYAEFVVPLVKAVQELSEENQRLKEEISEIKAMLKTNTTVASITTGSLGQNVPNPAGNSTSIPYTLPAKYSAAALEITDRAGKKINRINLTGTGKGNVLLNTVAMNAGAYQYSLYIDRMLVETRQLLIAK